jgi:four helix bundle protein
MNDITKRSFDFGVEIVKFTQNKAKNYSQNSVLFKQLLRSGTSIGANLEEAQAAESKADFRHKYNVALKEARETKYWLSLLSAAKIVRQGDVSELEKEADEISRIIAKIIVNSKKTTTE